MSEDKQKGTLKCYNRPQIGTIDSIFGGNMREITPSQLQLGELAIDQIKINPRSRDDIPQLLRGLQYLYTDEMLRAEIFEILKALSPSNISTLHGRPGMNWWKILIMGTLRLNLNCDYDRLQELVNEHKTIRQMLGHGFSDDEKNYSLQTLKDNVRLFTPEILDEINQVVVNAGLKLKKKDQIMARCDSFVVETHVHYPTDINLLFDAMRKLIQLTERYATQQNMTGWRQYQYNVRQIKQAYRKCQQLKRSSSNKEEKKKERQLLIEKAHQYYISLSECFIQKSRLTLSHQIDNAPLNILTLRLEIEGYIDHSIRQIEQIKTRVLQHQAIPHNEKVFSIFQPHTEWINKGKAGVPVELGLRVCIVESSAGFILNHQVMEKKVDNQIAVELIEDTQSKFKSMSGCSFDKGFHSPANQAELSELLDHLVLPKKGRRNKKETEREKDPAFKTSKRKHSAVESGINALEIHGLDVCPDHGIAGFKRYVALAVVARNIQKLGSELIKKEYEKIKRQSKYAFLLAA